MKKFQLNNEISGLLRNLQVRLENYPDLKANQNLMQIQTVLSDVEEQISAARRTYNSAVEEYNNAVEMFPSNFNCKLVLISRKEHFSIFLRMKRKSLMWVIYLNNKWKNNEYTKRD